MAWLTSIGAKLNAVNFGGGATNKRFHAPMGGAASRKLSCKYL